MSVNNLSALVSERAIPQLASIVGRVDPNTVRNGNGQSQVGVVNTESNQVAGSAQGLQVVADNKVVNGKNSPLSEAQEAERQGQQAKGETSSAQALARSLEQVSQSSEQLSSLQIRKLEFTTAHESGKVVVRVIDKESNDVIRQIPSEEFIKVAQKISDLSSELDSAQGLLFESKA